jgi:hypothetical protein
MEAEPNLLTPLIPLSSSPTDGPELIEGLHPGNLYDDVDANSKTLYKKRMEENPGTWVIIQILGPDPTNIPAMRTALLEALNTAFPVERAECACPTTNGVGDRRNIIAPTKAATSNKSPRVYLTVGLNRDVRHTLLKLRVIGTATVSFIVHGDELPLPSYLGTITGIGYLPEEANLAERDIKEIITLNSRFANLVQTSYVTTNKSAAPKDLLERTLASFRMKCITIPDSKQHGELKKVWNLYLDPPVGASDYKIYLDTLREPRIRYATERGGGPLTAPFRCSYCLNFDHPRAVCPIRDRPDWFDTAAREENDKAAREADRPPRRTRERWGEDRGRGPRGRGRGRTGPYPR